MVRLVVLTVFCFMIGQYSFSQDFKVFADNASVSPFKNETQKIDPKEIPNVRTWTYPKSQGIYNHLIETHGFTKEQIAELSKKDLVRLHSYDHEMGMRSRFKFKSLSFK